jgi:5-formyltetrahydrofolate cyclo-ligase
MNPGELKKAKRAVRRAILTERDALSQDERSARGAEVVRRFLELPEVADAHTVMAFWSFGSEVPTSPLLSSLLDRGVVVGLPRIQGGDLQVRTWRTGEPLRRASFGAMEPAAGETLEPASIDVICVPGVAFDHEGGRVGYGAGFYDRFLRTVDATSVRAAIAFDLQVVDEELPSGHADVPVDIVVTERRTLRHERRR